MASGSVLVAMRQAEVGLNFFAFFRRQVCRQLSFLLLMCIPFLASNLLLKSSRTPVLRFVSRKRTMSVNGVAGVNGTRSKHGFTTLKVNQSRLMDAIHTGCEYGAAHRYGR